VRVLHVDAGREWRGGQNQVRLLTRELSRLAPHPVDVRLATRRGGLLAARAMREGVRVDPVPWAAGLDPRAWWRLRGLLRTYRPDIVHVHDSHALTLVAMQRRHDPFRLVAHRRVDFHIRRNSAWFRADHLIAVSDAVRRILVSDGVNPGRISVIPDGVDPAEIQAAAGAPLDIRRRLGLSADTPLAVNVAALVPHKDQATLIRAAALARARCPTLHWVVAGDGGLRRDLERGIRDLGLSDRVHLLGYTPQADALIREADVFVMSSREEGLGSVLLEALTLDKPIVATAAGGIPELLPPDWLVPVGDAAALATKVAAVIAHPPAPLGLPPRLTAAAMAHATLSLYQALV
jgi:glycosyltransferase involved in cell wall biosynthesis